MTSKITIDELAGDLFGLNIMGLRSIITLWLNPARFFEAADSADWLDRYTPSVRLWLSLIAVSSLLQVFWIGSQSPLVAAYTNGFENAGLILGPDMTYQQLGEEAAVLIFAVFPIVQLATFLLILPLFRLWGRPTTFSLRVRYGFAMMIPSASMMLIILPGMSLMDPGWVTYFGMVIGLVAFLVDTQTLYRGGRPGRTQTGRLVRSVGIAAIALTLNTLMHALTQIAGIIAISIKYGLTTA